MGGDLIQRHTQWKCEKCGKINLDYYLNCMNCAAFKPKEKRKHTAIHIVKK